MYIRTYGVDVDPVQRSLNEFEHMLAFFTRTLRPTARPICPDENILICPVDGTITMGGIITEEGKIVAKRGTYTFSELVAGDQQENLVGQFLGGKFVVLYLSPKDYHRVHVPLHGTLRCVIHIPGALRPVRTWRVERFPRTLVYNERVVVVLKTAFGPVVLVFVGAMNVGSIRLAPFPTLVTNQKSQGIRVEKCSIPLHKGEELGHFEMGSTVVLCLPAKFGPWIRPLERGMGIQMGQSMAYCRPPRSSH